MTRVLQAFGAATGAARRHRETVLRDRNRETAHRDRNRGRRRETAHRGGAALKCGGGLTRGLRYTPPSRRPFRAGSPQTRWPPGTRAAALRAVPVLDAAHTHYRKTYAEMGASLDALPPVGEIHGGFRRLLAARPGDRLAALSAKQRAPRPHPYDSHPPIAERIALIEKLPADDRNDAKAGAPAGSSTGSSADEPAALTVLRDPDRLFAELEARTLPQGSDRLRRMSWDDLTMARAVADAEGWSQPLRLAVARALRVTAEGPDGTAANRGATDQVAAKPALPDLDDVLDAFDRGLLWTEVAPRIPKPVQASRLTGLSARNFIRPTVFDALAGMVHLRLAATGQATPDIAWSGQPGLALPAAWETGMDDALDAATADSPDTAPLRALLAGTRSVSA